MNEEVLIRQAITAEAEQRVDPGIVRANLREGRNPKRNRTMLVAVAGFAVAAAVVAVVVPLAASRDEVPPAGSAASAPGTTDDQNILLVGTDGTNRTDAVVLARLGADGSFRGVSLPRDTKVSTGARLNSVYLDAFTAAQRAGTDPVAAGAEKLMTTVKDLTGVQPAHYVILDMAGFGELSDAVGGVEVCLTAPLTDRIDKQLVFPAGPQTLAGDRALAFIRNRTTENGDLDRLRRQQVFLQGLLSKVSALPADPARLARLVAVVKSKVVADQGLDIAGLAQRLTAKSSMAFVTIPVVNSVTTDNMLTADPATAHSFTANFLAGTPAAPPPSAVITGPSPQGPPCVR
ncbi:LCP family protein required for cell wall assembly [Kibdelosporangium banguiense]|uniref:LCP family protein required for cell wall assembly n=1 Tax=Kibdelosporangium banguiense TaxID=1365924 RepID=A0ABS4TZK3_9PSEU|nr:LCP family protein [Kibdelosporangium banguiense]MBP2329832.1 LCP family protein required for cell wall assembly [Kibdelosporangium banguiense]